MGDLQDPTDGGTLVGTIFQAIEIGGIFPEIKPQNRPYTWNRYLQFRILEWPLTTDSKRCFFLVLFHIHRLFQQTIGCLLESDRFSMHGLHGWGQSKGTMATTHEKMVGIGRSYAGILN